MLSIRNNAGNSLLMVMIILVILSILFSALLLQFNKSSNNFKVNKLQAYANSHSGLVHFKKIVDQSDINVSLEFDTLLSLKDDSIFLSSKPFRGGLFVRSRGISNEVRDSLKGRLGCFYNLKSPLYLTGAPSILRLSGQTKIAGDIVSNSSLNINKDGVTWSGTNTINRDNKILFSELPVDSLDIPTKVTYKPLKDTLIKDDTLRLSSSISNTEIENCKILFESICTLQNVKVMNSTFIFTKPSKIVASRVNGDIYFLDSAKCNSSSFSNCNLIANNSKELILKNIINFTGNISFYSKYNCGNFVLDGVYKGQGTITSNVPISSAITWNGMIIAPSMNSIDGNKNEIRNCKLSYSPPKQLQPLFTRQQGFLKYEFY